MHRYLKLGILCSALPAVFYVWIVLFGRFYTGDPGNHPWWDRDLLFDDVLPFSLGVSITLFTVVWAWPFAKRVYKNIQQYLAHRKLARIHALYIMGALTEDEYQTYKQDLVTHF